MLSRVAHWQLKQSCLPTDGGKQLDWRRRAERINEQSMIDETVDNQRIAHSARSLAGCDRRPMRRKRGLTLGGRRVRRKSRVHAKSLRRHSPKRAKRVVTPCHGASCRLVGGKLGAGAPRRTGAPSHGSVPSLRPAAHLGPGGGPSQSSGQYSHCRRAQRPRHRQPRRGRCYPEIATGRLV